MAILSQRNTLIVLAGITAAVHLFLGLTGPDTLFILNGVGYIVLMIAMFWTPAFLKGQKALVRWAFIGFAAVTVVAYLVMNPDRFTSVLGLFTKLVEVLLIVGLLQSKE